VGRITWAVRGNDDGATPIAGSAGGFRKAAANLSWTVALRRRRPGDLETVTGHAFDVGSARSQLVEFTGDVRVRFVVQEVAVVRPNQTVNSLASTNRRWDHDG
jgi:hypothetical protein